ncbi:MAG: hypothetical protein AB7V58_02620 [Solirubrobacterales bacterium]
MKQWKFTSYQDGQEVTYSGLSHLQAVSALERAIAGTDPFPQEETDAEAQQRETEQLIAA